MRLAKAGVAGLAVHGTTGEPVLLSREERRAVLKATREGLDHLMICLSLLDAECLLRECDYIVNSDDYLHPTHSYRWETLELCNEAATLGSSFAMVVAPGYYRGVMTEDVIEAFFLEVADNSKIPIVLYNFPGIANGIDLDFPLIAKLAKHPNIVGIKLSCGSVAKGGSEKRSWDHAKS